MPPLGALRIAWYDQAVALDRKATHEDYTIAIRANSSLCGVIDRYHGNLLRGHYLGAPPKKLVEKYRLAAGAFDVIRSECRAGQTQREVTAILRRYYEDCGLWDTPGWALGYELGLSLPPDWVGDFYFNLRDAKDEYLDRVFEPGMVTNFESLFGTALIDTLIWRENGVEILGKTRLGLLATGG